MRQFSDKEILDCIRKQLEGCRKHWEFLYWKIYPKVKLHVLQNSGTENDAADIFQDSLVAFHRNVLNGSYKEDSSIVTYINSISRNLWLNAINRKALFSKFKDLKHDENKEIEGPESDLIKEEEQRNQKKRIQDYLKNIGEKCRKVLYLKVDYRWKMKDIAEEMGYKNEQIARNAYFKCKKRLRELIENENGGD